MLRRRDALLGAARLVEEVNRIGLANQPGGCATVGVLNPSPNSRNTIPGKVFMTVDLRHPDEETLTSMNAELQCVAEEMAARTGLKLSLRQIWHSPTVKFDDHCIGTVRTAARRLGLATMDIASGAGHDACHISRVAPTAMIFIPCEGGISHNEIENATQEHVAAGAEVLLSALLATAETA
jgi:N-carbamoyl-L-amino-acid hydrolase